MYPNEVVYVPPVKELAEILNMGVSTVYSSLKKIKESCPFLRIQNNSTWIAVYRTDPDNPKNFFDFANQDRVIIHKNKFLEFRNRCQDQENKTLEGIPGLSLEPPHTLHTFHIPHTGEEVDEKINIKKSSKEVVEEKINKEEEEKEGEYTVLPNHQEKAKIPPNVTQKKYNIPVELIERLRMAEIKTSEQVLVKISQHDISQAYGAVTHVENTFETIRDKTAVFLYQLPKQPIEKLGQRHSKETLLKQKEDLKLIEEEIKQGRKSLSDIEPIWDLFKHELIF